MKNLIRMLSQILCYFRFWSFLYVAYIKCESNGTFFQVFMVFSASLIDITALLSLTLSPPFPYPHQPLLRGPLSSTPLTVPLPFRCLVGEETTTLRQGALWGWAWLSPTGEACGVKKIPNWSGHAGPSHQHWGCRRVSALQDIVGATGTGDEPSTALRAWTSEVRGGGVSLCRELAVQEMTANWLGVGPCWRRLSFPIYYIYILQSFTHPLI